MLRSILYALAGLASIAAMGRSADAAPSHDTQPIGRIVALPPVLAEAAAKAEPMRLAGNSSNNSSRNRSRNSSNNSSNNSSDDDDGGRDRWRYN